MTLSAEIGVFMDFFGDLGLWHKSIAFARWCHATISLCDGRFWYLDINL